MCACELVWVCTREMYNPIQETPCKDKQQKEEKKNKQRKIVISKANKNVKTVETLSRHKLYEHSHSGKFDSIDCGCPRVSRHRCFTLCYFRRFINLVRGLVTHAAKGCAARRCQELVVDVVCQRKWLGIPRCKHSRFACNVPVPASSSLDWQRR